MDKLVFLIKSYRGHYDWTKQLVESIDKHNKDNIKVFIAVPSSDSDIFSQLGHTIITDEEIIGDEVSGNWRLWPGHTKQQLVKLKFSQLDICKNYFWIDADSYFIRDFFINDFMYTDDIPYTTIHENKDLFSWAAETDINMLENIRNGYENDRRKVMDVFNRKGKIYDWTCPNLWSVKVLNHMKENYMKPNNLSFTDLLNYVPGELVWYGEYQLKTQVIPTIPAESWFKPFHYKAQMDACKQQGNTEETLAMNYLGIVMPSKEMAVGRFS